MSSIKSSNIGIPLDPCIKYDNVFFVATNGDNNTAEEGNLCKPWADPWTAANGARDGATIIMFGGTYDGTSFTQVLAVHNNMKVIGFGATLENHWMIAGGATTTQNNFYMSGVLLSSPRFAIFRPRGGTLDWYINIPSLIFDPIGPTYYTVIEDNGQVSDIGPAAYGNIFCNIDYMEGGFYFTSFQTDLSNSDNLNITFNVGLINRTPPITNPQSRGFILAFDVQHLRLSINVKEAVMTQVVWGLSYFGQTLSNDVIINVDIEVLDYLNYTGFGHRGGLFIAEYGGGAKTDIIYNVRIGQGKVEGIYLLGGSGWNQAEVNIVDSNIEFINPGNSGLSNFGLINLSPLDVNFNFNDCSFTCDDVYAIDAQMSTNAVVAFWYCQLNMTISDDMFKLINNLGGVSMRYSTMMLDDSTQNAINSTVPRVVEVTDCNTNSEIPFSSGVTNQPLNKILPTTPLMDSAQIKMSGGTALTTPGTPVKINQTTTGVIVDIITPSPLFSTNNLNPDIQYIGLRPARVEIEYNISTTLTITANALFYIAVNGVIIPNSVLERIQSSALNQTISLIYELDLLTNDTLEVFVDTPSIQTLTVNQAFLRTTII